MSAQGGNKRRTGPGSGVGLVHVPRHKLVRCVDMCPQVFSPAGPSFAYSHTVHSFHTRRDRVASFD